MMTMTKTTDAGHQADSKVASTIASDIVFAEESGEFTSRASLLRYVVALNPDATVSEFVAAAVAAGYLEATARTCYYASRKFDRENY